MRLATIHYLTVQDLLWINQELCNRQCEFKFAQLEEAAGYQYGYGQSKDVLNQAGVFLQGFLKMRPFEEGNRKTAFVSALTFLSINGFEISLDPMAAKEWVMSVATKQKAGVEAIGDAASESDVPPELNPAMRTHVRNIIASYRSAIAELAD